MTSLNTAMKNSGASSAQFSKMRVLIMKLARVSDTKTSQDIVRYTIILLNQRIGKEEAINKMKTFLRG